MPSTTNEDPGWFCCMFIYHLVTFSIMFLACLGYTIYSVVTYGENAVNDPTLWGAVAGMGGVIAYTCAAICGCLLGCFFQ